MELLANQIRNEGYEVLEFWADSMNMFEHEGVVITNPFVDVTGCWSVDPIEYYGIGKIVAALIKIANMNKPNNVKGE